VNSFPRLRRTYRTSSQIVFGLVLFVIWAAGYFIIAQVNALRPVVELAVSLDGEIPFVPEFVLLYLMLYPMFLLPFFYVRNGEFFRLLAYAYLTLMIICYAVFLMFPVGMTHPRTWDGPALSVWILGLVYKYDNGRNCFPSMHAAMSMMASLTLMETHRLRGWIALLVTFAVGAAALFVRQHFIVDIFAGFALAFVVYYIYFKQRIVDVLRTEGQRLEAAFDQAIDARLEKRLAPLVERLVEEKLAEAMTRRPDPPRDAPPTDR
jgi:membrane-associated phospholipid phosphatase